MYKRQGYIIVTGLPYVNWTFLTTPADSMGMGGGIRDQLFNSLYLLVLTLIISVPLSLGAGIYLAEYAPKNAVTKVIRSAIEVLSSLPSIVIGLFGYLFFVVKMGMGFSVLAGAIALTFFNIPLLTRNCESALEEVPADHRAGGLALGLSRWKTVTKIMPVSYTHLWSTKWPALPSCQSSGWAGSKPPPTCLSL